MSTKPRNPARIGGAWIRKAKDGSEYIQVGIRKEELIAGVQLIDFDNMKPDAMVNFVLLENSYKTEDKHPHFNVLIRTGERTETRRGLVGSLAKRDDDVKLPSEDAGADEKPKPKRKKKDISL